MLGANKCTITVGTTPTATKLGVPYRRQISDDYCGAASTLMWRAYRRLPDVLQDEIYNSMGGPVGFGKSPEQIARAVTYWTGDYAEVDNTQGVVVGDPQVLVDKFFARQVASINNRYPFIPIVDRGFHAGVVNGGASHQRSDGMYVWDYVYFHDPDESVGAPDRKFTAGSWQGYMCGNDAACQHVINMGATNGAQDGYDDYADSTIMRGGYRAFDRNQALY